VKITDLSRLEKSQMTMEGAKDAWKQIPISKADGAPHFSLRVFTIEPGGHTPFHTHPFEHINYVIEGRGAVVNQAGEEREIGKGNFILIMPDERHQYRNTTQAEPLVIICGVPKEYE
jgi:quercetin dioxygenase-like cupin family protein